MEHLIVMDLFLVLAICVFGPIIGAALGVLKKPNDKFVFHLLSFAAGVMISIALFELLPLSIQYSGILGCVVGVFTGSLIMFFIDKLIPANHLDIAVSDKTCNLKKTSNSLFLAILLHHLPEGLTIAIGSMIDFNLTLVIAIGLGIHYIPESICVAVLVKSFIKT